MWELAYNGKSNAVGKKAEQWRARLWGKWQPRGEEFFWNELAERRISLWEIGKTLESKAVGNRGTR